MRVLGFAGSLRRDSYNRRLLHAAARLFPKGVVFEPWSGIGDLPAYNEELDGAEPPRAAVWLRAAVAQADALLFATPEYNSSVPGGLKNMLDWASRPYATNVLRQKPVAVIGASTGFFGAIWAQAELRKVLTACGARVLDRQLPVARASEAFAPDGSLADPDLATALDEIVHELAHLARSRDVNRDGEGVNRMRATATRRGTHAKRLPRFGSSDQRPSVNGETADAEARLTPGNVFDASNNHARQR